MFESPKNYNELLPKLNKDTFLSTLAFFIVLRLLNLVPYIEFNKILIPQLKEYKEFIEWLVSFGVMPLIAAFVALFFSYYFEMHNKISKILKIRFLWDKYFIVKPLTKKASSNVELTQSVVMKVMNELYYPEVKKIDQHYVQLFWRYALPFWILFEHAIIVFVTALVLTIMNRNISILQLWGYFIFVVIVTTLQLILVTGQKSTDQADQLPSVTVIKFFNDHFN